MGAEMNCRGWLLLNGPKSPRYWPAECWYNHSENLSPPLLFSEAVGRILSSIKTYQ